MTKYLCTGAVQVTCNGAIIPGCSSAIIPSLFCHAFNTTNNASIVDCSYLISIVTSVLSFLFRHSEANPARDFLLFFSVSLDQVQDLLDKIPNWQCMKAGD